jgi:hypothetical protein
MTDWADYDVIKGANWQEERTDPVEGDICLDVTSGVHYRWTNGHWAPVRVQGLNEVVWANEDVPCDFFCNWEVEATPDPECLVHWADDAQRRAFIQLRRKRCSRSTSD